MEDNRIVALYWERSETAIAETEKKYGAYCHKVAYNILESHEDAKECVNDAYLRAWNAIPPQKPTRFAAFLGKITRNLALDRLAASLAKKRAKTLPLLEEIAEALPDGTRESLTDELAMKEAINKFLRRLSTKERQVFLRRYFLFDPIKKIAGDFSLTETALGVMLHRMRKELKTFLENEGIWL